MGIDQMSEAVRTRVLTPERSDEEIAIFQVLSLVEALSHFTGCFLFSELLSAAHLSGHTSLQTCFIDFPAISVSPEVVSCKANWRL